MNSNDKAFLEKFWVEGSSILVGLENFGATVFSIMERLGGIPLSIKKRPNLHPSVPSTKFFILPIKDLPLSNVRNVTLIKSKK